MTMKYHGLRVSPLSITSFILALFPFVFPASFVLSRVAISEIDGNSDALRGKGLANAATTLSIINFFIVVAMATAYSKNLKNHREYIEGLQTTKIGMIRHPEMCSSRDVIEISNEIAHLKANPPSFFHPFN